jgi:hypothetical protein
MRGRPRFRAYIFGKLAKYGILVSMVCEDTTAYIGNMELYTAEGKTLEETILPDLESYLNLWYHVYRDNYYNNVEITEKLILRKTSLRDNQGQ